MGPGIEKHRTGRNVFYLQKEQGRRPAHTHMMLRRETQRQKRENCERREKRTVAGWKHRGAHTEKHRHTGG